MYIQSISGKRNCPGEDLAWVETYLYFVHLIQRYEIVADSGYTNLLGIANMAVLHDFCLVRRSGHSK